MRSLAFLALIGCAGGAMRAASDRPDIVIIIADDMGYSDLGCYGGEIRTPRLDALAAGGLRFRRFYNNSICCPTRASLLTGLYPHQAGMGAMTRNLGTPSYRGELNDRCVTIARVLKDAGYHTFMSGKWHVTQLENRDNWPPQRGFERFYGTLVGAGSFFAPFALYRNNDRIDDEAKTPGFYYTDAISDNAVEFVREAGKDRPLFGYVAYTSPHWPLHAFEKDVVGYKGVFDEGWDVLREKRRKRIRELGLLDARFAMSPREDRNPAWKDADHKAWQLRRMEVYAAQIEVMDRGIGRIVDALRETGRLENTLLFFLIDNGGCHVEYVPTRKGYYLPENTRDGRVVRPGNLPGIPPGPEDTYQSYGRQWANLSNTPFQYYKSYQHEGGILTPLIAHWPRVLRNGGAFTDQIGHVMDFMPTCLEIAGARYPDGFLPPEGRSLAPILRGQPAESKPLFWEYGGSRAARVDDWKLVAHRRKAWELYNLADDPTELRDLASTHPEKVRELDQLYFAWAARCGVLKR